MEEEGGLVLKNYQSQFIEIITNDPYIMSILKVVEQVNMNVSNRTDTSKSKEKHLEKTIDGLMPNQPWSVKNQARMHEKNGGTPYKTSYDGALWIK